MMTNDEMLTAADQCLRSLGLHCVGRSSISPSTYWQLSVDNDQPRLRLSNHAVVHRVSDCAVCLGLGQDDDVRLAPEIEDCCRDAAKRLLEAQVAHDRKWAEVAEDPEEDIVEAAAKLRREWAHLDSL